MNDPRWTEADEARFQALAKRRDEYMAVVIAPWFERIVSAALKALATEATPE